MKGSNEAGKAKPPVAEDGKRKNVGDALRAVYQDAAGESVPDEMLDLLSKLK